MNRKLIAVVGPTCAGKSSLAVKLAENYNGIVINADSIQLYRGIQVISAAPFQERVPHKLYGIWDPETDGSVFLWLQEIKPVLEFCWNNGYLPIVCGGTGLYLSFLLTGYHLVPKARSSFTEDTKSLYKMLSFKDPMTAKVISCNDRSRIIRALSILEETGRSLQDWYNTKKIYPLFGVSVFVLAIIPSRDFLYHNINNRVENMIMNGALNEVRALQKYDCNKPIMKALGVSHLINYLRGIVSFYESVELWKKDTRHYAKRQITWIRYRLPLNQIIEKQSEFFSIKEFLNK